MLRKQGQQLRLVPDLDAQLLRLVELGTSRLAGHDKTGFLGHGSGHLGTQSLKPILCFVTT